MQRKQRHTHTHTLQFHTLPMNPSVVYSICNGQSHGYYSNTNKSSALMILQILFKCHNILNLKAFLEQALINLPSKKCPMLKNCDIMSA